MLHLVKGTRTVMLLSLSGLLIVAACVAYYRCTHKNKKQHCDDRSFVREEQFASEVKRNAQLVTIPDEWKERFLARIETWEAEILNRCRIHARVAFGITFVNVLEKGGTLLRVKRSVVGFGQRVEHVLDGELDLRASGGLLPPVQNEQLLEPIQKFAGDFLNLGALVGAQLWRGAREDVEDDQFLLGHIFANMTLLLLGEVAAQFQQFLKQFFDVPAAGVVTLDQFFKLLGELGVGIVWAIQSLP